MSIILDGTSGVTTPGVTNTGNDTVSGNETITGTLTASNFNAASTFGFKNRIINGDMRIDQRNATSTTVSAFAYGVDRFGAYESTSATSVTATQSSTAPAGFINSLLYTVGTGGTATAAQQAYIRTKIEGLNISDLAWGTASAATVTLSFWVRSSLTGTYCVYFQNSAQDRSYVSTYTISLANTWEQKTITVAGDTSGTWLTTNGIGIELGFDLGGGSNYNTTANAWAAGSFTKTSAQANLIGTSSATFYITGVQLEVGSKATTFDTRSYGQELALCQRYLPSCPTTSTVFGSGMVMSTTTGRITVPFSVTTRTAPTGVTVISPTLFGLISASVGGIAATGVAFEGADVNGAYVLVTVASASFVVNNGVQTYKNSPAQLLFTGCEL